MKNKNFRWKDDFRLRRRLLFIYQQKNMGGGGKQENFEKNLFS